MPIPAQTPPLASQTIPSDQRLRQTNQPSLRRRGLLLAGLGLPFATTGCSVVGQSSAAERGSAVVFGVSAPRTGPLAEYGRYFEQGFEVALAEINDAGGIDGRPVELRWEDSQSDPKQSVPIAQKFVAAPEVLAELGDFSSGASMAATPVYQRAKLVQFGFTNSNPAFTAGGDRAWTTSLTQANYQHGNAKVLAKYARSVAVFYLQTDWGRASFDLFQKEAAARGLRIVHSSAINPDSQDFRPALLRALSARPDAIAHLGYGPDGGLLVKQLRGLGFDKTFLGGQATSQYLQIAGAAAEGTVLAENFSVDDPDPAIQRFVSAFRQRFSSDPGAFHVYAYDALGVLAEAARRGGASREGIFAGLSQKKPFRTALLGELTFNAQRRPDDVKLKELKVVKGRFRVQEKGL